MYFKDHALKHLTIYFKKSSFNTGVRKRLRKRVLLSSSSYRGRECKRLQRSPSQPPSCSKFTREMSKFMAIKQCANSRIRKERRINECKKLDQLYGTL